MRGTASGGIAAGPREKIVTPFREHSPPLARERDVDGIMRGFPTARRLAAPEETPRMPRAGQDRRVQYIAARRNERSECMTYASGFP